MIAMPMPPAKCTYDEYNDMPTLDLVSSFITNSAECQREAKEQGGGQSVSECAPAVSILSIRVTSNFFREPPPGAACNLEEPRSVPVSATPTQASIS